MTTPKKWKITSKENGMTYKKMEDDKTEGFLLAYNQSTKINLIGCDTIVNSPSLVN
jgi:hypothetical protein